MPKAPSSTTQCAVWEFRCNYYLDAEGAAGPPAAGGAGAGAGAGGDDSLKCRSPDDVAIFLKGVAKKIVFQREKGETGYMHYQGRMSLIKKKRKNELLTLLKAQGMFVPEYLQPSVTETRGDAFYQLKADTREAGPWTEKDFKEKYIPRQYRGMLDTMRPWQKKVLRSAHTPDGPFDPRTVNLLVDTSGNIGKSVITALAQLHASALALPPVRDFDRLMGTCLNILKAREERKPTMVLIDMPRGLRTADMSAMLAGIEKIKDGHVWDTRYHFQEWWFDSPAIWVFSNVMIDPGLLSADRWRYWAVDELALDLVPLNRDAPVPSEDAPAGQVPFFVEPSA